MSSQDRAVVTGAASGIGLAATRRLSREGMDVLAVDLPGRRLDALADEGFKTLGVDLATAEGRDAVVAAGTQARALVNSAGIIRLKPILDLDIADLHQIFAVNVDAVWDLTSRIGRSMPAGGAIVNLSSVAAKLSATTEAAVYAASKAAVLSITRSFAHAFAPSGVRVNALCPGIIDTPMQDDIVTNAAAVRGSTSDEVKKSRVGMVPLGRSGTPEECANLIWFLASDEAAYMTGQAVNCTGGMVMH